MPHSFWRKRPNRARPTTAWTISPPLAKAARIQGHVLLQAEISKDGTIQNLKLISGHPMLAPAAIEAVKQWRYKPYLLNGEPVAVETQVDVIFSLSGG